MAKSPKESIQAARAAAKAAAKEKAAAIEKASQAPDPAPVAPPPTERVAAPVASFLTDTEEARIHLKDAGVDTTGDDDATVLGKMEDLRARATKAAFDEVVRARTGKDPETVSEAERDKAIRNEELDQKGVFERLAQASRPVVGQADEDLSDEDIADDLRDEANRELVGSLLGKDPREVTGKDFQAVQQQAEDQLIKARTGKDLSELTNLELAVERQRLRNEDADRRREAAKGNPPGGDPATTPPPGGQGTGSGGNPPPADPPPGGPGNPDGFGGRPGVPPDQEGGPGAGGGSGTGSGTGGTPGADPGGPPGADPGGPPGAPPGAPGAPDPSPPDPSPPGGGPSGVFTSTRLSDPGETDGGGPIFGSISPSFYRDAQGNWYDMDGNQQSEVVSRALEESLQSGIMHETGEPPPPGVPAPSPEPAPADEAPAEAEPAEPASGSGDDSDSGDDSEPATGSDPDSAGNEGGEADDADDQVETTPPDDGEQNGRPDGPIDVDLPSGPPDSEVTPTEDGGFVPPAAGTPIPTGPGVDNPGQLGDLAGGARGPIDRVPVRDGGFTDPTDESDFGGGAGREQDPFDRGPKVAPDLGGRPPVASDDGGGDDPDEAFGAGVKGAVPIFDSPIRAIDPDLLRQTSVAGASADDDDEPVGVGRLGGFRGKRRIVDVDDDDDDDL